ncbi:MAG TPA: MFS transporter [Synergistaceae bacterium]|nr:MFS transporter [Synergistaceae bacterium]
MKKNTSFTALCGAAFIQMVGVGIIVALLPGRVMQVSPSMEYVGYLASAFAISFVLLQLPAGYGGDLWGYKLFLVGGYALSCLTGLLYFKAGSVWDFLGGRALQGLGEIPVWALAPALLSLLFPDSKGERIGKYNASFHLGLTLGGILSIYACRIWSGNEAFLLYAATGFLGAVTVALFVKNPGVPKEKAIENRGSYRDMLRAMRKIRMPAVFGGVCLYGGAYGLFLTVIPGILLSEKGFSQTQVSLFFALFYVALSIAQVTGGKRSDAKGRYGTMYLGFGLVVLGMATFMVLNGKAVFALLFCASFGLGMFCVSAMTLLNEAVPDSLKGSISGVFYLFWGIGFFLIPPGMAKLGALLGYARVFPMLAVLVCLDLLALRRQRKRCFE